MTMRTKPIAGNSHDGTLVAIGMDLYEGSRPAPGGKFEKRRFAMRRADAIREWSEWRRHAAQARPHASEDERKEAPVADVKNAKEKRGDVYVLCVVGGAPLFAFDGFDKAASVCSALEAAAKSSGFAAKYDVVKVSAWEE